MIKITVFRIFLFGLALGGALIIYDIARFSMVKAAAMQEDPAYSFGPPEAAFTLVEFLDYSCYKCQKTHPAVNALLKQDPGIRYIPRPVVSDNDSGDKAARFAYAAGLQGKFREAHNALLDEPRLTDDARINMLITKLGLNGEKIKTDMNSRAVSNRLKTNTYYNTTLGSPTVPAFLIGNRVFWIITADNIPTPEKFLRTVHENRATK